MKEIMNVNRRIILVSKICYDIKIDDYGKLCTFIPIFNDWKPHTFMWQNLEERDLHVWLALQKSIFLCDYLAKSDVVFTEL